MKDRCPQKQIENIHSHFAMKEKPEKLNGEYLTIGNNIPEKRENSCGPTVRTNQHFHNINVQNLDTIADKAIKSRVDQDQLVHQKSLSVSRT